MSVLFQTDVEKFTELVQGERVRTHFRVTNKTTGLEVPNTSSSWEIVKENAAQDKMLEGQFADGTSLIDTAGLQGNYILRITTKFSDDSVQIHNYRLNIYR